MMVFSSPLDFVSWTAQDCLLRFSLKRQTQRPSLNINDRPDKKCSWKDDPNAGWEEVLRISQSKYLAETTLIVVVALA